MFSNLGPLEIFLIVLVVLLLFGAKKIPELAQGVGKGMREFKEPSKMLNRISRLTIPRIKIKRIDPRSIIVAIFLPFSQTGTDPLRQT